MMAIKESTHWYTREGEPVYEVTGKNGKVRPTTLRDVREGGPAEGGVPGYSSVAKCEYIFGLQQYFTKQRDGAWLEGLGSELFMELYNQNRYDDLISMVSEKAGEHAEEARKAGVDIHAFLEEYFLTGLIPTSPTFAERVVNGVIGAIGEGGEAEVSFSCYAGYGGKIDLLREGAIYDFKSTAFDNDVPTKKLTYDSHAMQLAAYRYGKGEPGIECINVYVSTTHHGLVRMHIWDENTLTDQLRKFMALLQVWQVNNKYDSSYWPTTEVSADGA